MANFGLGVALILGSREQGWDVVETEGGHASFAPTTEEEQSIAHWIAASYGRASNERLLSGGGLSNIDAALRGVASQSPTKDAQSDLTHPNPGLLGAAVALRNNAYRSAIHRGLTKLGRSCVQK